MNHVCSLGLICHTSNFLKENNLKVCSYPFDWIYSQPDMIIHCIEDEFKMFLDKSYYIDVTPKSAGHSYYNKYLFAHRNPLNNQDDYDYYIRCVNRFKNLIKSKESKLFIMMFPNMTAEKIINENVRTNIINFNTKLSKYTTNYKLLIILHLKNQKKNDYNFSYQDNIHFLEVYTLSESNGVTFNNANDNEYLSNVIKNTYNFNIK